MTGVRYSQLCSCPRAPCRPTPCSRLHDRRASTEGGGLHPQQVPSWSPAMPSTPVRCNIASCCTPWPVARRSAAACQPWQQPRWPRPPQERVPRGDGCCDGQSVTKACPAPWDWEEAVTRERSRLASPPKPWRCVLDFDGSMGFLIKSRLAWGEDDRVIPSPIRPFPPTSFS